MIEFFNVIFASICAAILGAAIHSAYCHSRKRKELKKLTNLESN